VNFGNRRWWAAGGAGLIAAALAAAGGILLSTGSGSPAQVTAAQRHYTAEQACLLTDSHGIAARPASAVWAGMEDASRATSARVTYLMVEGPPTTAAAIPYANSLVIQHCNVVLAVGAPQTSAISAVAPRTPATAFISIGGGTASAKGNLKTIGFSADTETQVKQALEPLLAG
jgi:basic membrane lipoprotein Med (substrate-binding protein (PBP1-ABC) superfamily)